MTTVKDLILALQKFPMDTPVFIYNEVGECDGMVDKITFDTPIEEWDGDCETVDFFSPNYCQADSEAERFWSERGTDKPIVFLHSTNTIHDFTIN